MLRTLISLAALAGALVQPVAAQSFNIDFGSADTAPSDAYGAASGQAGHWDAIANLGSSNGLLDTDGAVTGVSLNATASGILGNPASSDVQLLESDFLVIFVGDSWSVKLSGISNGHYDLYFYATSSSLTPTNSFIVNGIPVQGFGPDPRGKMKQGVGYRVLHDVDVSDGTISAVSNRFNSEGSEGVSGMQIVALPPVPEPATWLLAVAGLVMLRAVIGVRARKGVGDRGRDAGCPAPPAQIRTCPI